MKINLLGAAGLNLGTSSLGAIESGSILNIQFVNSGNLEYRATNFTVTGSTISNSNLNTFLTFADGTLNLTLSTNISALVNLAAGTIVSSVHQ